MNNVNTNTDQILIQKLVDGELDHTTRSQVLSGIPIDSIQWKDIALAFVEKQIFDEAINSIEAVEESKVRVVECAPESVHSRGSRMHSLLWAAGLAACLLAGIFIGSDLFTADQNPTAHQPPKSKDSTELAETPDISSENSIKLAEALSRSISPVPKEFRRALLKAGYTLKENQQMAAVQLPTGGQIEVPVRNVAVTYVGLNSFQ